jgi:hypothetical protein
MAKTVVLVSTDLLAQSRVSAAADAAGWSYATAHPKMSGPLEADLLILDLDAIDAWGRFRDAAPADRTVGFYSHIDKRRKAAAEKHGVDAIPRGAFWKKLSELLDGV